MSEATVPKSLYERIIESASDEAKAKEERAAWDRYFAAASFVMQVLPDEDGGCYSKLLYDTHEKSAEMADGMLEERRKRWG